LDFDHILGPDPSPDSLQEENASKRRRCQGPDSEEASGDEDDTALIDTYSQLAHVLSGLRTCAARGVAVGNAANHRKVAQAFPFVSSLCDILKGSKGLTEGNRGPTSPCVLLAASIIAIVVETYHEQSGLFQSLEAGSSDPEPSTQLQAQSRMEAIVMDLHLAKLQAAIDAMGSIDHETHVAGLLIETRKILRRYLET
jgi:hypothetical protein